MASFSKLRHPPLADSFSEIGKLAPFPSHKLLFVDISTRFLKVTSPSNLPKLAFVRAASAHKTNAIFRHVYNHGKAMQNPAFLCRGTPALRSPLRKRRSIFATSASASYADNVEEGLVRLGGFCLSKKDLQIAIGAALTILLTVANKVLYKMALIPLKEYPFFLALINTFGYVVVYFSILYMRYQAGIVTQEMLETPKMPFVLTGALEAVSVAAGMAAAANLPGIAISVLLQTLLVWQLVLSMVFLKKRFSFGQVAACGMVLTGVAIALCGGGNGSEFSANRKDLFWPLIMIVSCAFQASSTIVKEFVFQKTSKHLKSGSLDIFVVNSYGSGFQSLFVFLMLPFLSQLRGIPFSHLHSYMKDGAGCLFNLGSMSTECSGAALLTLSYVVVNLIFNISLLSLVKMSSAVVSSLCSTLAVPMSIYIFTLPLPYIGVTASVHQQFMLGVAILLGGLALYNLCN